MICRLSWGILACLLAPVHSFSTPLACRTSVPTWLSSSAEPQEPTNEDVPSEPMEEQPVEGELVEEPLMEVTDEEPQVEQEEDPAMVKLREEIAAHETLLKELRRKIAYAKDEADDYSKAGYARKVAEMENMRRTQKVSRMCFCETCLTLPFL